jgi:pimeloyl-ACP methyl ester carboxylesterase
VTKRSLASSLANAGVAGVLLGAAVIGATAGVFGERYALRKITNLRKRNDPYAQELFGLQPFDEVRAIQTADGVNLHVEVLERGTPTKRNVTPTTVLFVHGFCLDMGTWYFQRKALETVDLEHGRFVFYDQAGHGRSDRRSAGEYSINQLADDLALVIKQVAPRGRLILVGHSMGGMALMAFAERYPKIFARRVAGAVLVSTSAGHLDDVALGLPRFVARLRKPLMPTLAGTLKSHPKLGELGRMSGTDLTFLLTRHFAFGAEKPSRALAEYVLTMNAHTAIEVIAGYLGTLSEHDRYNALPAFADIPTLVICGDKDLLTPAEHTREIARLIPNSDLMEIPDGGHLSIMEHHEIVTPRLVDFINQVVAQSR